MTRVAILDDYQGVARRMADWTSLPAGTELVIFADHLNDAGAVAARLADFDAVVAMRERTAFPRALLEKLPRLRLLVTTGMRNASIDVGAAVERGVIVCGTAGLPYPTAELTWGLILALVRRIPTEARATREGRSPVSCALVAAVRQGTIAGAGLDVYDEEPLPLDHPLRNLPNTVITPHLGYVTEEGYRIFYGQALEDVKAWLAGKPVRELRP